MKQIVRVILMLTLTVGGAAVAWGQGDSQAHLNRGFALYQQGQFQKALTEFEEGVKLNPARADGYRLIGLSYIQLKNYDKAIVALKKAVELGDQSQQEDEAAKIALGFAYYFKQQFAEALPYMEYAARKQESGVNYYRLAEVHYRLNNLDMALRTLEKAVAVAPSEANTLELMTQIYLQRAATNQDAASYAQAVKAGQKLKALRDDATTATLLGQAYLGAQQFKEAATELKKAVAATPNNAALQFAYGQVLARTEQWLPAQLALERAAQQMPNNAAIFNLLGYAYEAEGARIDDEQARAVKFTQALESYTKADQLLNGADANIKASIERVKPFTKKP